MAQPWGLIIILLMRKCQRPGCFSCNRKIYSAMQEEGQSEESRKTDAEDGLKDFLSAEA